MHCDSGPANDIGVLMGKCMVPRYDISIYGNKSTVLGLVVGAYGETSDDVYVIAEAVAEELATEHCGFYSDKKQGVVAAFFLSQIYRSWGLTAHHGWPRLMLDRRCLVEVPNAPRHRAESAHADADYDEETAFDNYFNPEAGTAAAAPARGPRPGTSGCCSR